MSAVSSGKDTFINDLAKNHEVLQQQRSALLGAVIDAQLGTRQLVEREAQRLQQKRGAGDPRVQLLRDRSQSILARVEALGVERDIASVRTPAVTKTGALVQGRVTDSELRAAGRMTVRLVNEKGEDVLGVPPVETDDAGYYSFVLPPATVAAIGANAKLSIALRTGQALAPAAAKPFTVAPGVNRVQEVALNVGELEKLGLRLPLAEAPTPGKPPPTDKPPTPPKSAAPRPSRKRKPAP